MYGGEVMPGRQAGSGGGNYNAESLKQGSKRFNSITKTIHFSRSKYIIYAGPAVPPVDPCQLPGDPDLHLAVHPPLRHTAPLQMGKIQAQQQLCENRFFLKSSTFKLRLEISLYTRYTYQSVHCTSTDMLENKLVFYSCVLGN